MKKNLNDSKIKYTVNRGIEIEQPKEENEYPLFFCSFCGQKTRLTFNPVHPAKNRIRLEKFICPTCKHPRSYY